MGDGMCDIVLRPLKPEDCDILFGWRNDPWIVSLSASQKTVSREEHDAWFAQVISDKDVLARIICDEKGVDMGLVRVAKSDEVRATITIYLMQPHIGCGRGPQVIEIACKDAFLRWPMLQIISAWIRAGNDRSIKAFRKIGFGRLQPEIDNAEITDVVQMRLNRKPG